MIEVATSWRLDVSRGPDCLFVAVSGNDASREGEPTRLDDLIWAILDRHFTYRVVLELDQVDELDMTTARQINDLRARVEGCGGLLRICGISPASQQLLSRLLDECPVYRNRSEAVMGGQYVG